MLTAHENCEGTRDIPEESASSLEKDVPAGDVYFPRFGEIEKYVAEYRYLFAIDGEEYFLITHYTGASEPDWAELGYSYEHYKALRHAKPKYRVFALMTGYHLHCWYRDNAHCEDAADRPSMIQGFVHFAVRTAAILFSENFACCDCGCPRWQPPSHDKV